MLKKYSRLSWLFTGIIFLSLASPVRAQDFKVIAHSSVADNEISKADLSKIYMGEASKWPNGQSVAPTQLKSKSSITKSFLKSIDIDPKNYKRHWRKKLFSGNGTPPAKLNSDSELIDFVKNNEGSIGFVSSSANLSGVKEIKIK